MQCGVFSSSESVMPGHPDKLADQISDAILDAYLQLDPKARVAVETFVTKDKVLVAGEVRSAHHPEDIASIVRNVIKEVGYIDGHFNYQDTAVDIALQPQSRELDEAIGDGNAGDQSIVFGYATCENDGYIPAAAFYANMILQDIHCDVQLGALPKLGPDGKILVNVAYKDGWAVGIESIALSLQHTVEADLAELGDLMFQYVAARLPKGWLARERFYFNPSGSFLIGGPVADTGLTGRKIVVDSFGAGIPVGGGAFSGKDASKLDRSGAYMARYLAKNVVASGLADRCLIKLVYCIGVAEPVSFMLDTFGTARVPEGVISDNLRAGVDLRPSAIFERFDLGQPIYRGTTMFGHCGRPHLPWEEVNLDVLDRLVV